MFVNDDMSVTSLESDSRSQT